MITAVDSSVLLDILTNDPVRCQASLALVDEARRMGRLVLCPVVWAEIRAFFHDRRLMKEAFSAAGLDFDPFDEESASLAGELWGTYRRAGGRRRRLLPDFLVAAHAQVRADCLLTRDRGFYRRYFRRLKLKEPKA